MSLLKKGVFLLSIDTEMAWGRAHRRRVVEEDASRDERDVIYRLLKLFEKYETRATWAIVGHLFLEQCRPANGRKHPEIIRPSYRWFNKDWFDSDPCSDIKNEPGWYGCDIVERIRECKSPQEIGSHTFSHIIVGATGCSPNSFDSELRMCQQLAGPLGLTLRSFVFPRNSIGHLNVLAKNGFIAYRGRTPAWSSRFSKPKKMLLSITDRISPRATSAVFPDFREGLWDFPATYFYNPMSRWKRKLPSSVRLLRVKQRLNQAVRQRALFHLWFHPSNLTSNPDTALNELGAIFWQVNKLREAGKLDNLTMGELADSLRHEYPLPPCTSWPGSDTA